MDTFSTCSSQLVLVATIFQVVVLTSTTPSPVWSPQSSIGFGRNIRHLPCVSRRSGDTGVCMFAFSCAKANGTHLGTCIDRFYFGSCCKLELQNQDIAEPLDSNHIYEEPPRVSTENYHISTYQSVQVTNTTEILISQSTTTPRTPTVTTTPKPTKKPVILNEQTVTVPPLVYTHKPITSNKPTISSPQIQPSTTKPKPSSKPSYKPQTTSKPVSVSKPPTNSTKPPVKPPLKPVTSTKPKPSNTTSKPFIKPNPQKPTNNTTSKPVKPSPTKRPTIATTTKPHRPSSQKPVQTSSRPTVKPTYKPQTKPPLKPVPVVTIKPSTNPDYVKLPVVTVSSSSKPTFEPVTISNEVVQKPVSNLQSNQTVESEEENSNVINESAGGPTTSSTLLVTWTTVDEVPVPPFPKPASTPSSPPIKNETKPIKTTTTTTSTTTTTTTSTTTTTTPSTTTVDLSFPTWVQVPVSTLGPTGVTKPSLTSEPSSTAHPSQKPTITSGFNTTATEASSPVSVTTVNTESPFPSSTSDSSRPTPASTGSVATPEIPSTSTEISLQNSDVTISNLNMSDYLDVCGRRLFPQSRIVGGDKATFGKWPWQISLRQWRTSTYLHKCGAALLNENWAITAAHCVENVAPSDLLLRLGEHDLSLEDEPYGYQERRVQIVASHPQFDPRTFEYDLALLRFYEPVTFQPNIIPVCVPQDDTNFVGSTAFVTGWGRLYEDGPLPSVLQEVSVPVINNSVCETMYRAAGYIEHIPEIFICAGWKKGGFDSCEGDSGGPMVIQRPDKRWLLAGVISWGIGCAEPNQPGVYTRISEFRGWINQILQF